jgi:hypothetical protein
MSLWQSASSRNKRRTTLTLPAGLLAEAERIAHARKVNLSTVIAEALNDGLRLQVPTERSHEVLDRYKRLSPAFPPRIYRSSTGFFWTPFPTPSSRRWPTAAIPSTHGPAAGTF